MIMSVIPAATQFAGLVRGLGTNGVQSDQPLAGGDPPLRKFLTTRSLQCSDPSAQQVRPEAGVLIVKSKNVQPESDFSLHGYL